MSLPKQGYKGIKKLDLNKLERNNTYESLKFLFLTKPEKLFTILKKVGIEYRDEDDINSDIEDLTSMIESGYDQLGQFNGVEFTPIDLKKQINNIETSRSEVKQDLINIKSLGIDILY